MNDTTKPAAAPNAEKIRRAKIALDVIRETCGGETIARAGA